MVRFTTAVSIGALVTSGAFAQEADTEARLGTVTVTGQKIERSLQDTKESVAVISDVAINDLVLLDLEDVFNATANAYAFNQGESYGVRGISQNSASTGGGDGELGSLYIDGVAYTGFATRFGPKDLWDVEQIEILRGPQSTNVGRNALAGAVVVNTKRPSLDGFEAAVRGQVGNYNTYSGEGMVNFALNDTSALRFTAEYLESDGFMENVTLAQDDYDARENLTLRGKYLFEPNDRLSVLLSAQYAETERGQDLYRADLTGFGSRQSSANLEAFENYEGFTTSLDVTYDINDRWSIRSITSFLDGNYERLDDDDEGPDGGENFRARTTEEGNWAEELRFTYTGDRLTGVIGGYYTELNFTDDTFSATAISAGNLGIPASLQPFYPAVIEVGATQISDIDTTNMAIFTEWDFQITDRLSVSAGFRFDDEEQDRSGITNNTSDAVLPDPVAIGTAFGDAVGAGVAQVNAALEAQLIPIENGPETVSYDAFLPKFGLTYDLTDTVSLSAFYKRGYRAGGVEFNSSGVRDPYDPEYIDNYEIALRSIALDGRLLVNANAYYGIWTDQQVRVPQEGNIFDTDIQNAGESTISGLELEVQFAATDDTTLYGSVGYAYTEFDEFCLTGGEAIDRLSDCEVNGVVGEDLSGNDFAFSPDVTLSLGGRHQVTDTFYVSGNASYQDGYFSDVENSPEFETDAFTLVSLKAGYERDGFEIAVFGTNLLDETYSIFNGVGLTDGQLITRTGPPLEYGVTVTKTF